MPHHVQWKILGNPQFHKKLISVFGPDRFINVSIENLALHMQPPDLPFDFLGRMPEHSLVVPSDFESLRFLSRYRGAFGRHAVCPLVSEHLIDYLDDKRHLTQIAAECGIFSPKEYSPAELRQFIAQQRFVIKPFAGSGSAGVYVSHSLSDAINYLDSLSQEAFQSQVIQEYIDGEDYYYYAICRAGKVTLSGCIRPTHLGNHRLDTRAACFSNVPALNAIVDTIVAQYHFEGPISIDFRKCNSSGKMYLIEINPRNGAKFHLFSAAKVNWLRELARLLEDTRTPNCPDRITTSYVWLHSYRRSAWNMLLSCDLSLLRMLAAAIPVQIWPDFKIAMMRLKHMF